MNHSFCQSSILFNQTGGLKILSCGAGMQSTSLALMSCENALYGKMIHPDVPIYSAIIFCDLGLEPPWVYEQVSFIQKACKIVGIHFRVLSGKNLYNDYIVNFGVKTQRSIPFWSISPEGKKGKMPRQCTINYKIEAIQSYVRYNLLSYKKGQRNREEDIGSHEMHIGFSSEETTRVFQSKHTFYVNKFPLIEMGWERPDSYRYCLEQWGLNTKASACCFCPFHTNYFYWHLKQEHPSYYESTVKFDNILEEKQPLTKIKSRLFLSKSMIRIHQLKYNDCLDKKCFIYKNRPIWDGF